MLGVQSFVVKRELSKDTEGTLKKLSDIGFDLIEPMLMSREEQGDVPKFIWSLQTLKTNLQIIESLKMKLVTYHSNFAQGKDMMPIEAVGELFGRIKNEFGLSVLVISGMFFDKDSAELWADRVKAVAPRLREKGVTLCYHVHADEFNEIEVDGKKLTAFDYFMNLVGDEIMLEPDIGWIGLKADEVEFCKKYADKILAIHLKDFAKGSRGKKSNATCVPSDFVPIGEGEIRTKEVIDLIPTFKNFNGVIIIDQDDYDGDMFEALKKGYKNVTKMLNE